MSDTTASSQRVAAPVTLADLVRDVEPMGDLGRFVLDDMTPAEEDEFFGILDEA